MIKIEKQKILAAIIIVFACLPGVIRANDNPFNKSVNIDIGNDREWVIKDKAMTRSGAEADDFYHFSYDRKQLRLRITNSADDSEASARQYQQFTVEDVQVDGQRLPLFQWCLANQEEHARFLQQGLKVKQNVCVNQGELGTFTMRLNAATLEALNQGAKLSFKLKPFRLPVSVNIDISDFSAAAARLTAELQPVQKQKAVPPALGKKAAVEKKCNASAPKGFDKIKAVEYNCTDAVAKVKAEADIKARVEETRTIAARLEADKELKRKQAEAERAAKQLAEKKAEEERLAAEEAALAEIEASKLQINAEITDKMLAVCMKQWQKGQHRCYCEEFIEHAPAGIESDASCGAK